MTTNKPEVFRFHCHGQSAPAYSCNKPTDNSGEYVRLSDYEALQAELEKMKQPVCSSEVEEALEELHDMIADLILAYTNEGIESGISAEEHLDILATLPIREPHTYRKQGDDE